MNRLKLGVILTVGALMASVGLAAAPAHAASPTPFSISAGSDFGHTKGGITWYNRSVGVQGEVCNGGGTTTAAWFYFYTNRTGSGTPHSYQSRTAPDGACRSFNWTEEGPVGGILSVHVYLCAPECGVPQLLKRP
ncbi:hypothetical protein [Micromonospora sp. C28ISP2-4]|uniref:hypothetical protein n=1 Tax=Micromonospora sp. C28ISP2-4 TaxID=3059523 RepID=UPI002676A414|nr:hypothetical protein [Micromonospora sp. C28ISP2-4]MDO3683951.1 hypothetical protein [Micromonospora sp. C28ISP2-4]